MENLIVLPFAGVIVATLWAILFPLRFVTLNVWLAERVAGVEPGDIESTIVGPGKIMVRAVIAGTEILTHAERQQLARVLLAMRLFLAAVLALGTLSFGGMLGVW